MGTWGELKGEEERARERWEPLAHRTAMCSGTSGRGRMWAGAQWVDSDIKEEGDLGGCIMWAHPGSQHLVA